MAELITKYDRVKGRAYVWTGCKWKIHWTADMISYMKRKYPTTKNDIMAEALGINKRTIIFKAREMGLYKDPAILNGWRRQSLVIAHVMYRAKGSPNRFKPGNKFGFQKGQKIPEEQLAKRGAAMKRTWERKRIIKMAEQLTKQ